MFGEKEQSLSLTLEEVYSRLDRHNDLLERIAKALESINKRILEEKTMRQDKTDEEEKEFKKYCQEHKIDRSRVEQENRAWKEFKAKKNNKEAKK